MILTNNMDRKIVIDTGAFYRLKSDDAVFKMISQAGFTHYDYTLMWIGVTEHIGVGEDFKDKAREVKMLAESYGLTCEQTHAYFTGGCDQESINRRIEYTKKDIEIASILGAKSMVLHPISELSLEENYKIIKENYLEDAHRFNIKIAIENIWLLKDGKPTPMCSSTPNEFVKLIDMFNDEYVVACLDIGHAEMCRDLTTAVEMIKALGNRLYALHIHDNDRQHDAHQVPYTQKINFHEILEALKEIEYPGNITFEIETCYNRGEDPTASLPFELYPEFVRLELKIGEYFKKVLDE